MASYDPSLFGTNAALQSWESISNLIDLKNDGLVVGMRPDIESVSITRVRKNKKNLLEALEATQKVQRTMADQLVFGKYLPEGILVLAFLFMELGVYVPSMFRGYVGQAVDIEKDKAQRIRDPYNKKQRLKQLNRVNNAMDNYQNGTKTKIDLYRSKKGKGRAKARTRKDKTKKSKIIELQRQLRARDYREFSEIYLLLRMFYGTKRANELFDLYIPGASRKKLLEFMQNEGLVDERNRPTFIFKEETIGKIRDYRT